MIKPVSEDTRVSKFRDLKNDYYSLTFGPFSQVGRCRPGSFVHLRLPSSDVFFRRPMSVAAVAPKRGELEIIFKVFGKGTRILADYRKNAKVNILGPLGNHFRHPRKNETTIIVAGGVGFPPLLFFATELVEHGYDPKKIEFFYGGRTAGEIVEQSRIKRLGVRFHPVTDDGSCGRAALVTEAVDDYITTHKTGKLRLYGCGPDGMLKATDELGRKHHLPGQLSLEAPMPCGIGICLGCVVPLRKGGHARVCCEGPVFEIGEVVL